MGILQSLFENPAPPENPHKDDSEPVYELSKEKYDLVYPVLVNSSELDAVQHLIDADRDTQNIEGYEPDFLKKALEESLRDASPVDRVWSEKVEEDRQQAEQVLEAWKSEISGGQGIVFMPTGMQFYLEKILWICEARDEQEEDPFELPAEFPEATSFVKRLKDAQEGDDSVYVMAHVDDIPILEIE